MAVTVSQTETVKPRKKYFVVSSDCQVSEPLDLWERRIEAKLRHRLPRIEVDERGRKMLQARSAFPIMGEAMAKQAMIDWGEYDKAPDEQKRWLGAWLISRDGEEGEYFYDGLGGVETAHDAPAEVIGFRPRWWPPANTPANLVLGPLVTLTEDYFFPEGPEQQLAVKVQSLVR